MPDDNDKSVSSRVSSDSSEMELWTDSGRGSRASSISSLSSSPHDGASHLSGPIKIESPEQLPESWITESDAHAGTSRVPFTKREKEFLCCLIQKHVYSKLDNPQSHLPSMGAFNHKKPISPFCRVPNVAWNVIEREYNSKENVRRRSTKQLRKCWENLKHRGNIDPAALYSGKRLHAKTSMSGAFTLTTDGEEDRGMNPHPSKQSGEFVETSLEDNSPNEPLEKVPPLVSPLLPTDLTTHRRSNASSTLLGDMADSLFQRENHNDNMSATASVGNSSLLHQPSVPSTYTPTRVTPSVPRSTLQAPRITNVRTVRSLKPTSSQPMRRRFNVEHRDKSSASRIMNNFSMVAKNNTQKIHEMKVKLLMARIKEHEANIQKVRLHMQHAQAHHDVNMRLLRTKAAWYDAHLRKLEKQLGAGDLSMVGEEEEEEYQADGLDDIEMQYDQA